MRSLPALLAVITAACGGSIEATPADGGGDSPISDASVISDGADVKDASRSNPLFCGGDMGGSPQYCDAGDICCYNPAHFPFTCGSYFCDGGPGSGIRIECDDQLDCMGGVCCGDLLPSGYTHVSCKSTCAGKIGDAQQIRFCDPKASTDECASQGQTCGFVPNNPLPYYVCR